MIKRVRLDEDPELLEQVRAALVQAKPGQSPFEAKLEVAVAMLDQVANVVEGLLGVNVVHSALAETLARRLARVPLEADRRGRFALLLRIMRQRIRELVAQRQRAAVEPSPADVTASKH